jgi:hypothetical protein
MDDPELSQMLRKWKAPDAPPTLRDRVLPRRQPVTQTLPAEPARHTPWRWLLTGTIRVPVPVGIAAIVALAFWIYLQRLEPPLPIPQVPQAPVTLADFQPVARLEPKIVGEP